MVSQTFCLSALLWVDDRGCTGHHGKHAGRSFGVKHQFQSAAFICVPPSWYIRTCWFYMVLTHNLRIFSVELMTEHPGVCWCLQSDPDNLKVHGRSSVQALLLLLLGACVWAMLCILLRWLEQGCVKPVLDYDCTVALPETPQHHSEEDKVTAVRNMNKVAQLIFNWFFFFYCWHMTCYSWPGLWAEHIVLAVVFRLCQGATHRKHPHIL